MTAITATRPSPLTRTCVLWPRARSTRSRWCSATWAPAVAYAPTTVPGCCAKTVPPSTVSTPSAIRRQTCSAPPIPAPGQPSPKAWSSATSPPRTRGPSLRSVVVLGGHLLFDLAPVPRTRSRHSGCAPRASVRLLGPVEILDHLLGKLTFIRVVLGRPLQRQ